MQISHSLIFIGDHGSNMKRQWIDMNWKSSGWMEGYHKPCAHKPFNQWHATADFRVCVWLSVWTTEFGNTGSKKNESMECLIFQGYLEDIWADSRYNDMVGIDVYLIKPTSEKIENLFSFWLSTEFLFMLKRDFTSFCDYIWIIAFLTSYHRLSVFIEYLQKVEMFFKEMIILSKPIWISKLNVNCTV